MVTLRQAIAQAESVNVAIGHFNISNVEALWAIFSAARSLGVPVIIGVSEGERAFIGARQAVALVKSLREQYDYPIFINADHTYTFELVQEAVDAGFDSVIFDGAKLSLEDNIEQTKKCVEYARSKNPEIIVEAELGYIGSSSKLLDDIPEGASAAGTLTKPEDAARFIEATDIDMLAPAVGNLHGMFKHRANPSLDIGLISAIRQSAARPLVLHGGSGITDEDFTNAIKAGISVVHINTEIRVAYRKALTISLQDNQDEIAPYKYLKPAISAVQQVVENRLRLFNNLIKE
jgi:fructose-bisphosphate aldolase class II